MHFSDLSNTVDTKQDTIICKMDANVRVQHSTQQSAAIFRKQKKHFIAIFKWHTETILNKILK